MVENAKIVLIDSGVYMQHPNINKTISGYGIKYLEGKYVVNEEISDEFGHGTAIYGIVEKHCKNAEIIPVKIFGDSKDNADVETLIFALEFIEKNIQCDVINMSVGVSILQDTQRLYKICKKLAERDIILVSAFDNFGAISYPAEFECVIGVSESELCRKRSEFIFVEGSSSINVLANGNMQRCFWKNPIYQMCGGNSFACAHVSGIIANNIRIIKEKYKGNVKQFLKDNAIEYIALESSNYNYMKNDYNGEKVAIFPFNKENHSLIRYKKLLPFEITGVYDTKYSGKVGAYTNQILKDDLDNNYLIKNIDEIDYESFSLLVIGHTKELEQMAKISGISRKLIRECLERGKKVYSYDEYVEFKTNEYYFDPNIKWKREYERPLGKLYRSSIPVVGVFGTTSRQGKFSLQLILREKFLNSDYKVGQIASEPTGLLFSMDYCFPFGYGNSTNIVRKQMVQYINGIMHCLEENKEVIIVGCQSSTLPYDNGNIKDFTFSQIEFLFSTSPDCVVLCVNSFDLEKDIRRTISFIESSIETKVVALVIYPMKLKNVDAGIYSEVVKMTLEEEKTCIDKFKQIFGLPTYILGKQMDDLFQKIINFFD